MAKQHSGPKHSAPVELTEDEVRAAREGKGTHELPDKPQRGRQPAPVKAGRAKATKR